ncbi:S1C family serine protease [Crocinitomix catalasitica]|uniref:S1C family serine protease n=1 Tax=Crocinitomix catalasitica TaxID=184607 RepID=UPI000A037534|nr:trypsin-like peptidase domain-containing protein [Crocinitomix catalasitica]
MKANFLKIMGASAVGCLIGGLGVRYTLKNNSTAFTADQAFSEKPTNIKAVSLTDTKADECLTYANLTPASEKGVESVVHITTEFVREEITYDPFMKLFYGEDAYKTRQRKGRASGSGVVVSPEGYIVTNNHVVQDASKIKVSLNNVNYEAELIGTDPSTDLAVIKIDKKGLDYLDFGNSDELRLGEWVLAIGNPLNLQTTITAGIVSAKNRNIDLLTSNYNPEKNVFPVESFIQTDAAVNSGNSGGALVNQRGELIGINTAIASGNGFYTGYSFAIPANIVKKVAFDLIQHGEVKRVQLGVNIMENNSDIAKMNQLGTEKGIVITGIINGGNASKGNLKVKDVIVSVENKSINSIGRLQAELVTHKPGDTIELGIQRGNKVEMVKVLLE